MYFLIGYKESRENYHGEGNYDRYESDFHYKEYPSREKLIEGYTKLLILYVVENFQLKTKTILLIML
jgi:hypothetical protein